MTNTGEEIHRVFFHEFISVYSRKYFPIWVKMPSTAEEIASSMKEYTEAGLPGCIGVYVCF